LVRVARALLARALRPVRRACPRLLAPRRRPGRSDALGRQLVGTEDADAGDGLTSPRRRLRWIHALSNVRSESVSFQRLKSFRTVFQRIRECGLSPVPFASSDPIAITLSRFVSANQRSAGARSQSTYVDDLFLRSGSAVMNRMRSRRFGMQCANECRTAEKRNVKLRNLPAERVPAIDCETSEGCSGYRCR
jgi:hypothetical protein